MAYRFHAEDVLSTNQRVREAVASAPSPEFGAHDAIAVWLGMRDDASTLRRQPTGLIGWIIDYFGFAPKRPLADPRLESLRRLTVSLRLNLLSREWEEASARRAGVTGSQIRALCARFAEPG